MTVPAMVSISSRDVHGTTRTVPSLRGTLDSPRGSSSLGESPVSRLATISLSYSEAGICQPAQNLLVAAGEKEQPQPMHLLGENGIAGAVSGRLIQFRHLSNISQSSLPLSLIVVKPTELLMCIVLLSLAPIPKLTQLVLGNISWWYSC